VSDVTPPVIRPPTAAGATATVEGVRGRHAGILTMDGRAPLRILLVEDNAADARLLQEVLRESSIPTSLTVARDGIDALALLHERGRQGPGELPNLIFLDLRLPRMDGRQVLAEVRSDPALNVIPVVIFTSVAEAEPGTAPSDFHPDGLVRKPLTVERFEGVVRSLGLVT
jgi:chemotaxis family two-component system response regulator Rcp1